MAGIYIPGVRQSWAGTYGWSLNGGPRKFILHSTETDSAPGCVDQLCHYLDGWANPHVVWDPWTGDMAMCGRADWGEGALVAGNRDGTVVLQVEAVGRAGVVGKRPFTDSPMLGWPTILAWADSWGIPHVFPAGMPLPYPQSYGTGSPRPVDIWNSQSGYYGHSQVPANDHGDPGLVDLAKIFPTTEDDLTPDQANLLKTIGGAVYQMALNQAKHDAAVDAQLTAIKTDVDAMKAAQGPGTAAILEAVKAVPAGTGGTVDPAPIIAAVRELTFKAQ